MYRKKLILAFMTFTLLGMTSISAFADLILSAPPRGKAEDEQKIYVPMAVYISKLIGQKVVYKHPGEWGIYQANMQTGKYDIVFDGPHFVAWRMSRKDHEVLATTPGNLSFVVVVRSQSERFKQLRDLRGRSVCGMAPPNLATLMLMNEVGVGHEPRLVLAKSFNDAFEKMLAGECDGAVLRDKTYDKLLKKHKNVSREIFRSKGLPNQAITASKNLTTDEKDLLKNGLLSAEAMAAMPAFMEKYTGKKGLRKAESRNYLGVEALLKDIWGFGI